MFSNRRIYNKGTEARLKKKWLAVLLPTHPQQALPAPPPPNQKERKKNIAFLRLFLNIL